MMQDNKQVKTVHRALRIKSVQVWGTSLVLLGMLGLGIFWTYSNAVRKSTESSWIRSATGGYVGHWEWNIDTDALWWDAAMMQMFDANTKTSKMTTFLEKLHPDDSEYVGDKLQETINSGKYYEVAYRIIDRQGNTRCIAARGTLFPDSKLFSGVCIPISKESYENTVEGSLNGITFKQELRDGAEQLIRTRGVKGNFSEADYNY